MLPQYPSSFRLLIREQFVLLVAFAWFRWSPVPGGTYAILKRAILNPRVPPTSAQHLPSNRTSAHFDYRNHGLTPAPSSRYPHGTLPGQPDRHDLRPVPALPIPHVVLPSNPIPALLGRGVGQSAPWVGRVRSYKRGSVLSGFRVTLWVMIEYAWWTFPSTTMSSAAMLLAHLVILGGLWYKGSKRPREAVTDTGLKDKVT